MHKRASSAKKNGCCRKTQHSLSLKDGVTDRDDVARSAYVQIWCWQGHMTGVFQGIGVPVTDDRLTFQQ